MDVRSPPPQLQQSELLTHLPLLLFQVSGVTLPDRCAVPSSYRQEVGRQGACTL